MFEQVHSKKYYLQIVEQIRGLVVSGKLKAGDRLPPERELSIQFGTSRASIREALSALEIIGIVETKSGQGNFIKAEAGEVSVNGGLLKEILSNHSPYEIFEARLGLEPCMAYLAALRATEEEKELLAAQLESLNRAGRDCAIEACTDSEMENYLENYMEEDRKLHLLIGQIAHNSVLYMVFSGVNLMMKEAHWKALKSKGVAKPGSPAKYEAEHTAIVEAILCGDCEKAREEMIRHISVLDEDLFQSEEDKA